MKKIRVRLEISAFMMLCVFTLSVLSINAWALRQLAINSGVNIAYDAPGVLSVSQPINQSDPAWDKEGYNATLNASAVKVESNSLSELAGMLTDENQDGNPDGVTYTEDDYYTAPVYRKIDNVNVDINTGEIIGKLSDPDYPFEWYGREVTLPSGYTLASGRTLTEEETFTVDVYTYYPEMYIARYIAPDEENVQRQYIHIAETLEDFREITMPEGITPAYVKEWYTATFEATIFNPDHTVAKNSNGVIPRSYVYDSTPVASGSASYLISNYNYNGGVSDSLATVASSQSNMMLWASNLTKAWENVSLGDYKSAKGVQGENYTVFIYNLLYLVKYAHNNSQEMVGLGNDFTNSIYTGKSLRNSKNATFSCNSYFESQKGGGTIGVHGSSLGTATYVQNTETGGEYEGDYMLSATGYDAAGMSYGYTYRNYVDTTISDYVESDKRGLYTPQFLVHKTSKGKRVLRDGYVGSNGYTSVFCLGMSNAWGNVGTFIFAEFHILSGNNAIVYFNFEDYDYKEENWILTNDYSSATNKTLLDSMGYQTLGFYLPNPSIGADKRGWTHMDVDSVSQDKRMTLIGLPSSTSAFTENIELGTCDYYYNAIKTQTVSGLYRGGFTHDVEDAGIFTFYSNSWGITGNARGLRTMLIL